MDYKEQYNTTYRTYFSLIEKLYKKKYITYKNEGYTFNLTYNELHKEHWSHIKLLEQYFSYKFKNEYFKLFNDRFQIFENSHISNIINKRIIPLLKKNNEDPFFDFNSFIHLIAKLDALKETSRLLSNNSKLIDRMFALNDFKNFEIKSYPNGLENSPLFQKLNKKLYPTPKETKLKITVADINDDEFLNIKEVAALTNYAVATIYDLKHKGKIPFYKKGAKLQFKKSEILDWLQNGKGITKDDLEIKAIEYILKNS